MWRPEIRVPRPLPCELDLTSGAAACGRGARPRLEAAGGWPARIPTLVAWSALCGICGGVGETPALRTLAFMREIRELEKEFRSLGVGPQPPQTCGSGRRVRRLCADHCACITYLERVSV